MSTTPDNPHNRPPGYTRSPGRPFIWADGRGVEVDDENVLRRLESLALPPAWSYVWAAMAPESKVQATGVDSRGRTQYRYSSDAVEIATDTKFRHALSFAAALPGLRLQVRKDLDAGPGEPFALEALAVRLLDEGLFRVGNERYARDNHTYGLTTLTRSQVSVSRGQHTIFDFVGKEHLAQTITIDDPTVAKHIGALLERPDDLGALLFVSSNDGSERALSSSAVNAYLHAHTSAPATAKVFRTWGATVAAAAVSGGATAADPRHPNRTPTMQPFAAAALLLGNTVTVARTSYVHPRAVKAGRSTAVREAVAAAKHRTGHGDFRVIFKDSGVQAAVLLSLMNDDQLQLR